MKSSGAGKVSSRKGQDDLSQALHLAAVYVQQPRFRDVLNEQDRDAFSKVIIALSLMPEEDADVDVALLRTSRAHGVIRYLLGKVGGVVADQKDKLAEVSANLDEVVRTALRAKYPKITETMVDSAVRTDPNHLAASSRYRRAEELCEIVRGIAASIEMRFRGLEQVSNNERQDSKAS